MEEWRPVVGWEGIYEVSSLGKVRSTPLVHMHPRKDRPPKHRYIKHWITHGYPTVCLCRKGRKERVAIHRLVMRAFVGMPGPGEEVCHNNGIRSDAALSNLRYATRAENHADKIIHGTTNRGERSATAKLTSADVISIREDRRSQQELGRIHGVSQGHIHRIKSRVRWAHIA